MYISTFQVVWDSYHFVQRVMGISEPSETWQIHLQRLQLSVLTTNDIFVVLTCAMSAYHLWHSGIVLALLTGFAAFIIFFLVVLKFMFIKSKLAYDENLEWCTNLSNLENGNKQIEKIIKQGRKVSTTTFKNTIILSFSLVGLLVIATVLISLINGKIMPALPAIPIWTTNHSSFNMFKVAVSIIFCGLDLYAMMGLVFGVIFITIESILTVCQVIQFYLCELNFLTNEDELNNIFHTIIDIHFSLIERQKSLKALSSFMVLFFEPTCYGLALFVWVIVKFDPSQL